ncbi:arabinogalactan protein 1 [Austrofundulus limnaeus]|uniref:Arabinogalactan protein 1 n=1 Tax=Austrofundulus limnaeus TaxID=52670 RepID=A0A2I4CM29_AUSLI|nr:PREDICTED: arabinogalactan protein 1-like [Austrofundulus limnaeus]
MQRELAVLKGLFSSGCSSEMAALGVSGAHPPHPIDSGPHASVPALVPVGPPALVPVGPPALVPVGPPALLPVGSFAEPSAPEVPGSAAVASTSPGSAAVASLSPLSSLVTIAKVLAPSTSAGSSLAPDSSLGSTSTPASSLGSTSTPASSLWLCSAPVASSDVEWRSPGRPPDFGLCGRAVHGHPPELGVIIVAG